MQAWLFSSLILVIVTTTGCQNREKTASTLVNSLTQEVKTGIKAQASSFTEASIHFDKATDLLSQIQNEFADTKWAKSLQNGIEGLSVRELRQKAESLRVLAKAESEPIETAAWLLRRDRRIIPISLSISAFSKHQRVDILSSFIPIVQNDTVLELKQNLANGVTEFSPENPPPPTSLLAYLYTKTDQSAVWKKLSNQWVAQKLLSQTELNQINQAQIKIKAGKDPYLESSERSEILSDPITSLQIAQKNSDEGYQKADIRMLSNAGIVFAHLSQADGVNSTLDSIEYLFKQSVGSDNYEGQLLEYFWANDAILSTYCEYTPIEKRLLNIDPLLKKLKERSEQFAGQVSSVYSNLHILLSTARPLVFCGAQAEGVSLIKDSIGDLILFEGDYFAAYGLASSTIETLAKAKAYDLLFDGLSRAATGMNFALLAEYYNPEMAAESKLKTLLSSAIRSGLVTPVR